MWYQRATEASATPLCPSDIEAVRVQQQYRTVKDIVVQSLLLMKSLGCEGREVQHIGAGQQMVGDVHGPGVDAVAMKTIGTPAEAADVTRVDLRTDDRHDGQPAASVWQENRMVLSAMVSVRSMGRTTPSPPSFISKLLGPRKFKKSVNDGRRR